MLRNRVLALGCVAGVTAVVFGCGDASSPVAPSASLEVLGSMNTAASPSVHAAIDPTSLGTDTVDLKSAAPTPLMPINNVEVEDLTPTLTSENADGLFQAAIPPCANNL